MSKKKKKAPPLPKEYTGPSRKRSVKPETWIPYEHKVLAIHTGMWRKYFDLLVKTEPKFIIEKPQCVQKFKIIVEEARRLLKLDSSLSHEEVIDIAMTKIRTYTKINSSFRLYNFSIEPKNKKPVICRC